MDWVDRLGNVFDILNFEFDGFEFEEIEIVKKALEPKFLSIDWDDAGQALLKRKDEWHHLDFFAQSNWKCDYLGIEHEQFKMVCWQ